MGMDGWLLFGWVGSNPVLPPALAIPSVTFPSFGPGSGIYNSLSRSSLSASLMKESVSVK